MFKDDELLTLVQL